MVLSAQSFNTTIAEHVSWLGFIFRALLLEAQNVFLLKLFDFYFFVEAHSVLKFKKIVVIHHRNKLMPTHNYQVHQLTLQAI